MSLPRPTLPFDERREIATIPVFVRLENIKLAHMSEDPLAAERARGDLYRELLEVIACEDEAWARSIKLVLQAEKVVAT